MAQAIPPILVQIQADVTQLKASMAQAEASIKGVDGSVATANTGMQNMMASAKKMAGAMGVAFAATQIVQFGKDVIMSASSMQESISKVNVVFGDSAEAVFKFGDAAAKNMGMSNQAAIEAAGTYGNLFQAFGIGQGKANEMSTTLVQLAADLGSFNNTSTEEAINALRSGLSGETEPLKRFGVAINEVTLKNKAMAMGFGEIKGAMDPAMKAQVTYALVMEQTKLAQGDYARTADGTANTMKTLSAQFADAKVAIGDILLPAFNALLSVFKVAIPLLKSLAEFVKKNKDVFSALAIGVGVTAVAFGAYKAIVIATTTATKLFAVAQVLMKGGQLASIASTNTLAASILRLNAVMRANPIGLVVTAIALLVAGFVLAYKKSETFRNVVGTVAKAILTYVAFMIRAWGDMITIIMKVVTGPLKLFLTVMSKLPGVGGAAKSGLKMINGAIEGVGNFAEKTAAKIEGLKSKVDSFTAAANKSANAGAGGGTGGGAGGGGNTGGGTDTSAAATAAKAAKEKADKIKKSMADVAKIYDSMNKEILEAQEKVADATKRRDEDTADAHKRYNETVADADKRFMETSAEANEQYNERVADVQKRYAETKTSLHKRNAETIASATKTYNEKVSDLQNKHEEQVSKAQAVYAEKKLDIEDNYLEKKESLNKRYAETVEKINTNYNEKLADLQKRYDEQSVKAQKNYLDKKTSIEENYVDKVADLKKSLANQTAKLESDAANKSIDLAKAASNKQVSIVQDSINRLRSAFASKTGASLSDAMGDDKSASSLLDKLKEQLSGAKTLAQNAALLQGQGFSQTFIEQVVGAGPEIGNSLAGSILAASPASIAEMQATFQELEKTSNYGLDALATTMNAGGKLATDELMKAYQGVSEDLALALAEVQTDLTDNLAEANTKYQEAMTAAATVRAAGLAAAKAALDEALLTAKTTFDEGVIAATKTMNEALVEANKALAEGLAEAEKARTAALAEADKTLKAALAEAKKNLDEGLVEAAKALAEKIAEANKDLEEGLVEADKDLKEALAEAKKDLDKTLAAADKTYKEALADAQKTLTETLAEVQKTYKESLDDIAKETDKSIAALKVKLVALAATLKELGAKQAAIDAVQNAPKYVPFVPVVAPVVPGSGGVSAAEYLREQGAGGGYTLTDAMNKTGALSTAEYLRESGGINITQNISYPTASVSDISAQTLSAIKFGTTGGRGMLVD